MAGLSRRNTIIGLGALVGGTGVLAASGAFTQVEAQRTVDIETAGDADALLTLEPGVAAELVNDGDEDIIEIEEDAINVRARSTFEEELAITNNSGNEISIDILDDFEGNSIVDENRVFSFAVRAAGDSEASDYAGSTIVDTPGSVGNDETIVFDIVINYLDEDIEDMVNAGNYSGVSDTSTPVNETSVANEFLAVDLGDGDDYVVIEANQN